VIPALVMRVLLAFDKFKGSLSAIEACEAMEEGLGKGGLEAEVVQCPIADGGEGFAAAMVTAMKGSWQECRSVDALGRKITARYGLCLQGGKKVAVMEMAEASGYWRIAEGERDVMRATTAGTGKMIRHAAQVAEVDLILLGLGGSATNDGGAGMAASLGVAFRDASGNEIEPVAKELARVVEVFDRGRIRLPKILVACDVENPLLGPEGATAIYGPQKGAGPNEQRLLENMLARLVQASDAEEFASQPGAGAAGGLGFGLLRFAGAELRPGFEMVSETLDLEARFAGADVVVTGEGSMDAQTLSGKGPAGVARLAREAGAFVVGVGGRVDEEVRESGLFDLLGSLEEFQLPLEESMARGAELLRMTGERLAGLLPGARGR
jgi:glycerate kinase